MPAPTAQQPSGSVLIDPVLAGPAAAAQNPAAEAAGIGQPGPGAGVVLRRRQLRVGDLLEQGRSTTSSATPSCRRTLYGLTRPDLRSGRADRRLAFLQSQQGLYRPGRSGGQRRGGVLGQRHLAVRRAGAAAQRMRPPAAWVPTTAARRTGAGHLRRPIRPARGGGRSAVPCSTSTARSTRTSPRCTAGNWAGSTSSADTGFGVLRQLHHRQGRRGLQRRGRSGRGPVRAHRA
jgi:hypothetical protein